MKLVNLTGFCMAKLENALFLYCIARTFVKLHIPTSREIFLKKEIKVRCNSPFL